MVTSDPDDMAQPYYKHHVFFCINQREGAEPCCAARGSVELQAYAKERIKALRRNGPGAVRINKSGCLDRCDAGPCLVVYPDGIWYTFFDKADIDEIIDTHLVHGRVVERLRLT
jgi:(2Fe-2S) ferredoxin